MSPQLVQAEPPRLRVTWSQTCAAPVRGLAWLDIDRDGDADLAAGCADGVHLWRNDAGILTAAGRFGAAAVAGLAWADANLDGCLDLAAAGPALRLWRGDCKGGFADVTDASGLGSAGAATSVAWGDLDRDARIDLVVGTAEGLRVWHAVAAGGFEPGPAATGFPAGPVHQVLVVDLNRDANPEVVATTAEGDRVLRNLGNGSLRDASRGAGITGAALHNGIGLASLDFNHDGLVDLVVSGDRSDGAHGGIGGTGGTDGTGGAGGTDGNRGPQDDRGVAGEGAGAGRMWRNPGDGSLLGFPLGGSAQAMLANATAVAVADFNNDGWQDVLASTGFLLGLPTSFGGIAVPALGNSTSSIALTDVDGDGWMDAATASTNGTIQLLHNDRPPVYGVERGAWVEFRLHGNQSNGAGLGAHLTIAQGSNILIRDVGSGGGLGASDDAVVHVGLGQVDGQLDAVEILWPSGIRQVITELDTNKTIDVQESASSKTSCPLLFVWDGTKVVFVSDAIGNAYTGWLVAPGVHHPPDPDELIRVDDARPREGAYEFRLLEALEETDYIDHAELIAVDHAQELQVIPEDSFRVLPPYPHFGLVGLVAPHAIASASDDQGPAGGDRDVTELVRARDRQYPTVPVLPAPKFDGYSVNHTLTFDLGSDAANAQRVQLAAWGWIYYPMVVPRLVVEGPYIAPLPPALDAWDPASGRWVRILDDVGFPMGLPKWWSLDLSGRLPPDSHVVRITTNLRVYWDQILVDTAPLPHTPPGFDGPTSELSYMLPRTQGSPDAADAAQGPWTLRRMMPTEGRLEFAGYPKFASPDGREPPLYDYQQRSPVYPWTRMAGNYTRFGAVTDLLAQADDRFVTYSHGEALVIRFDAKGFPPVPEGQQRTLFLWLDGFTKDTEAYNAFPTTVAPLPFHAMSNYPYGATEHYPDDSAHAASLALYDTRQVGMVRVAIPEAAAPGPGSTTPAAAPVAPDPRVAGPGAGSAR